MTTRSAVKEAVSAGGVVWRRGDRGVEVVLCGRTEGAFWCLPKGTPDGAETIEQAALREVREETGLVVDPGPKLGAIDYWFAHGGVRYHKYVHHWLMQPTGGSLEDHDHEFDTAAWFPISEALRLVKYDNERRVLAMAASQLGVDL